ncbi:MAG: MCE family protein [Chitinivibrionales bacterium]|nr:MCE family protein [Chitinivibrionales bacterium]
MNKSSEAFHIRYRNFLVGLFLAVPAAVLISVMFYEVATKLFEKSFDLHVCYAQSIPLKKNSEVLIRGIPVGHIKELTLDRSGTIQVAFDVKEKYRNLVRIDSKARLKQKSFLVGDWTIELTIGSTAKPIVRDNDTLQVEVTTPVENMLAKVEFLLGAVQQTVDTLNAGRGTLGRLLKDDSLYAMVLDLGDDVDEVAIGMETTLRNFDQALHSFETLGQGGKKMIDSAVILVDQFNGLMENVDSLVTNTHALPKNLEAVMAGLTRDIEQTEILLKALQRHWLLRRSVKKVKEEENSDSETSRRK